MVEPLEARRMFSTGKILFIRGASGTGGFIDGGTLQQRDEELADINNHSTAGGNHGWGELADLLRAKGFAVEQAIEPGNDQPVNLAGMNLSQYRLIVFGSNNGDYTPGGSTAQVDAVRNYVLAGGGALFVSDGNFGSSWGDAPSSDQDLLNAFGLVVNQDRNKFAVSRSAGDFLAPSHPILNGVNSFDGEGVSPGVKVNVVSGVTAQVIARATQPTRDNDNFINRGTDRDPTTNDGALVVAAAGRGRVAIHFDRNTFFNANGVGTNLHQLDNTRYAQNLFDWLTRNDSSTPQVLASDFRYQSKPLSIRIAFNANVQASLSTSDISVRSLTTGATIGVSGMSYDTSNNAVTFTLGGAPLPDGNYRATLKGSGVSDGSHTLSADANFDFYVLSGDANRDRKVDMTDFSILSSRFGQTGQSFQRGNFDYDAGGNVDLIDFTYLASNFNKTLAQVTPAAAPALGGTSGSALSRRLVDELGD